MKYLKVESWGHCFVGSKESTVRWVCSIDELGDPTVIAGQCLNGMGKWEEMSRSEMADVQESIVDNDLVSDFLDYGLEWTEKLPDWAAVTEVVASRERPSHRG
jgi:hypothetical protein